MSTTAEKILKLDYKGLHTLPEETAREYAEDSASVKGYDVYFIQLEGGYGYSCFVYKDGRIIPYAGDIALNHKDMYRADLRAFYLKRLSRRLFTEYELIAPLKDYDEYRARVEFLINDFGYQRDFVSQFYTKAVLAGSLEEKQENERIERLIVGKTYNPVGHGWYEDADFVRLHVSLFNSVCKCLEDKKKADDYDFWFTAFKYEMFNHEYAINWQGNWDVLSCFGKIEYDRPGDDQNLEFYFNQLSFTLLQRRAYRDARNYVLGHSDY